MFHLEKSRRAAVALSRLFVGIVFLAGAFNSWAQTERAVALTNLARLTRALDGVSGVVGPVGLEATVFACDTNSGALLVTDASGAELLEMDGMDQSFEPGDVVEIHAARCWARASEAGICVSAAPLVNDDGAHAPRAAEGDCLLEAGRYPMRVDWFNQSGWAELGVTCVETNGPAVESVNAHRAAPDLIHVTSAECYEGNWSRLPNFQLLRRVKAGEVTNFDISFRTRDELAGIRFHGYVDIPRRGAYHFGLQSDDGSLLWIGNPGVAVKKIGRDAAPQATRALVGERMSSLDKRRLVTLEGRVSFLSRFGKGLRFEIRSGPNSVLVTMADAESLAAEDLLNALVRVTGVGAGVLVADRRIALGRLAMASAKDLAIIESAPGRRELAPVLTTILEVHSLTTNQAARRLPLKIRGVVTAFGPGLGRWMAMQDDTRGGFVRINGVSNCTPNVGEFWEVTGHTEPGDFAPIIRAEQAAFLGQGGLPEAAHPTWNQLANGSMDVQWAEVQGLVTGVNSNWLSLLLPEGRQEVQMEGWGESDLRPFQKAVVRVRGTLFAVWNAGTHEVQVGRINMRNASVTVDKPAPADPFEAPEKTPRGLFLFDAKAEPFQRVKVRGQVTHADAARLFIERGAGIQVLPADGVKLKVGDVVEAVGYPDLSGAAPSLREAIVRQTGSAELPKAPLVSDDQLSLTRLASMRVCIVGTLAAQRREEDALVLQLQTRSHLFLARVANAASAGWFRPGSELSVTGVCIVAGSDSSHFELLVSGPADIAILSQPPWWTLQRLLSAVGVLLATLSLAVVWITLLRRQVAQRTLQLQSEIRERERAERQHALEAERSRIARDLHDDLGSSLTEINVLATTGQRPRAREASHPALFQAIADKARGLIAALDVIVWAVDPEDNSLQSLADYLGGYTREYLSHSGIACRFKIPVTLPEVNLDGDIRHELLMVIKETLNNIVRHAGATEVEFQIHVAGEELEICVADNGKGFDPSANGAGHGLKNCAARLKNIGGRCHVESGPGEGTTVLVRLPLQTCAANPTEAVHTTYG